MYSSVSEVSKFLKCSPTHTKSILKSIYTEEEIERSKTGVKIQLSPKQVRDILEKENIIFDKTIATISQQKGGVGKSTITINTAIKASQKGVKVLVVDVDPESNASSFFLDPEVFENTDVKTIKDILKDNYPIDKAIYKTRYDFVEIVPCRGTARKADRQLHGKNYGTTIREKLQPLLKTYDLILIDQGPSFNALNVSCYLACDKVLMPVDDSIFSIEGISLTVDDIIEEANEFKVPVPEMKLITNKISKSTISGQDSKSTIEDNFSEYVTGIDIPKSTLYTNSINNSISIFESSSSLPKHKVPFDKIFEELITYNKVQ